MQNLRFAFAGSAELENNTNRSQVCQDLFALTALDGLRGGTFLDIGASDPERSNNTWLLEHNFGWNGIAIELNGRFAKKWAALRKCQVLFTDALAVDYRQLLGGFAKTIDYLSLDIDPPGGGTSLNALNCLKKLLDTGHRFAVITFEHDAYRRLLEPRDESRVLLTACGYVMACGNVAWRGGAFEDWWLDPQVIAPETIAKLQRFESKPILGRDYIFQP